MRRMGDGEPWRYGLFSGDTGREVLTRLQDLPDGRGYSKCYAPLIVDVALGYKMANRPRLKVHSQFKGMG